MNPSMDEQRYVQARLELTRRLDQGHVVLPSRLAEAFLNVPRHPFVPVFYRRTQGTFAPWRESDGEPEAWVAQVYADDSLITEVDGVHAEDAGPNAVTGIPTSSSTAPSLMADMLDALDVRHGARVLEIGTGTGYNAALLCWLAGAENVVTVDRSERLCAAADTRLKSIGLSPTVKHADGAAGVPEGAPFDRVIATCSVPRVPQTWIEQCATGGILVVPLKGTLAGGMLARLTKLSDGTAAGHILHTPAAFMPLRSDSRGPTAQCLSPVDGRRRPSPLSGRVLDDWTFSFFAQLHLGLGTVRDTHRDGRVHVTTLSDPADGSVARVTDREEGPGAVADICGPRDLWASIERAHDHWLALHRPRREWFTVEATAQAQTLTYAEPGGRVHRWTL